MSLGSFTGKEISVGDKQFGSGLNTTAGALSLDNTESSDLQNIDFSRFGSFFQRNGYNVLNSTAIANSPEGDGLHWYEYDLAGTLTRKAIAVADGKLFKMDGLDGTWDDITGALTITAGSHVDFETFLNDVYMTNGTDAPWKWDGAAASGVAMTVPAGLTNAKWVCLYNNYLFLGNVTVGGVKYRSRIYWCNLANTGVWDAADHISVSKNDGQEITGMRVLADRMVVYKERSIYALMFTGDADIPFILPGGGKSNSSVGCISGFSIQDALNSHVFLAYDGIYLFDGANSFKLSDRINTLINSYNDLRFPKCVSMNQKTKNKYWLAMATSGATENDVVITWDYVLNSFSLYSGMAPAAMTTFYVNGTEERPYFMDYAGYCYRSDIADTEDDYPLKTQTAINAYYKTNWRAFGDLVNQKGVPEVLIYYQESDSILTFAYSYDFELGNQYAQTFSISAGGDLWDAMVWDEGEWSGSGGKVTRRDLTGRGRVIRLIFSNATIGETFRIDGLGTGAYLETNV